jgi:hypothetical protein
VAVEIVVALLEGSCPVLQYRSSGSSFEINVTTSRDMMPPPLTLIFDRYCSVFLSHVYLRESLLAFLFPR